MSKSLKLHLEDILQLVDFLLQTFSVKTRADLYSDKTLQFAVSYAMQHIGEAANRIPEDFRVKYPQVMWKDIINLRHRLAHSYTGTSYSLIYEIILRDIPALKCQIEEILKILPQEK